MTERGPVEVGSVGRRGLRAGLASLEGLVWLARVGPAPVGAWACAMGWGRSAAFSHAQRLEREGWLVRYPMLRGQGSLLVASSLGVRMAGVAVSPARPPAPTWWAHLRACGWVAAWLTVRGRVIQGCREVDDDPSWRGEVQWSDRRGRHRVGHCPDLVVRGTTPVEVELARKSDARLAGVMVMYRGWVAAGRIPGVMYVVESQADAERIRTVAARHELNMRVELLEVIVAQALEASGARATTP